MFIKLDLTKAYDRVNQTILTKVLVSFGFVREWIKWFMIYVTSSPFLFLINSELFDLFGASQGLHQDDPLSPYLFILMAR